MAVQADYGRAGAARVAIDANHEAVVTRFLPYQFAVGSRAAEAGRSA
ncbi:MAG: hypothetical protein JO262_13055 [Solirubrobacterales bacterium]|nr:hypothetical protein [Solirubrobacterales bacterium]